MSRPDTAEPPERPPSRDDAQRRQITVLFCDVVGSTTLAGQLDPEDFREVLTLYQEVAVEATERYGGYVTQLLGDGVVACFGYPRAHEDDAQRAVYAGLDILNGLGDLNERLKGRFDVSLQVRIGCHTGLVVAGAMEAGPKRDEFAMVGETPNVAARLQGVAAPGTLVISEVTQALVRGYFETEPLGQQTLAGVSRPVGVYRVLRSTGVAHRLDMGAYERMTPLVGRTVEMEMLLALWRGVQQGRGALVQIGGEAGIGKSRLVNALAERVSDSLAVAQRWQCSRHHQSTALYPVIRLLESRFELDAAESRAAQLEKLHAALLAAGLNADETLPLLADLLSLAAAPAERHLPADAHEERTALLRTLQYLLVADPAQHPMLLVIEDLHWADPTTVELLWRVLGALPELPVLCVVTHRDEFTWPWPRQPGMQIELGPLSPDEVRELAGAVAEDELEEDVLGQVCSVAEGIPLFVEEMLKMLALATHEEGAAAGRSEPAVPATLHGLLTERLDLLSDLGGLLDVAAVLGREFDRDLLEALQPLGGMDLGPALTKLAAQDVVRPLEGPPARYEFKHALLHDAAYSRVLRRRRQELHARVASTLVERFAERAEREPELVALHFASAGEPGEATPYWRAAGVRALLRAAFVEAAEHFRHGLDALEQAAPQIDDDKRRADFLTHLGAAVQAGQGYSTASAGEAYTQARVLWKRIGNDEGLLAATRGQWHFYLNSAEYDAAYELADEILALGDRRGQPPLLAEGHHFAGMTHMYRGELQQARERLERAISILRPEHSDILYQAQGDPETTGHAYLASVLSMMGMESESLAHSDQSLELAARVDRPLTHAMTGFMRAILHLSRAEVGEFTDWVEKARAYSVERNIRYWRMLASAYSNWRRAIGGDHEAGVARLEASIDSFVASGARLGLVHLYVLLADLQLDGGASSAARDAIARAEDQMVRSGERLTEIELLRCKARVLLRGGKPDPAAAIAALERAVDVGEHQGARLPQLRALGQLVTQRRRVGSDDSADVQRLAELCEHFGAESQLADVRRARAILEVDPVSS